MLAHRVRRSQEVTHVKIAYSLAALCVVGLTAAAQTGGFSGPDNRRLVTVAELATLPDDTPVRLVGYVVESVGAESYTFRDGSGTVVVEIDDDDWNGLDIRPEIRVEVAGEVDRDGDRTEVEVDTIRAAD
jgi:uncharacterized protein (TIGR00156 family)